MKTINIKEYSPHMGLLIDVQHPIEYEKSHHLSSINIHSDKLIYNHKKYLNKNQKYFITCKKGLLSKKAVITLEYYGYDVTLVNN